MDVLIFDMDGVLVDVSGSYRKTIQKTVSLYLALCLGFSQGKETPVTQEEISLFKAAGGFNNDWDLTAGVLLYLISISGLPKRQTLKRFSSMDETLSFLKKETKARRLSRENLLERKDIPAFTNKIRSAGGGLSGIRKVLGSSWDGWLYGSGDLNGENLVKRIFQEVYLGRRFRGCYGLERRFYRGRGFYLYEKLLIPRSMFATLRKRFWMGIASGRPRYEAELALRRFRLTSYFQRVVTLDECLEEEERLFHLTGRRFRRTKPHPYPLLRVIEASEFPKPRCAYVGDVVDDMKTAKRAEVELPIVAVGFLPGKHDDPQMKQALFRAGAQRVVTGPAELFETIMSLDLQT